MPKKLLEIAADIIQTQASSNQLSSEEIVTALKHVFGTLQDLQKMETEGAGSEAAKSPDEAAGKAAGKGDPKESILDDRIICLECGAEMRQLTARHLSAHGLSLREYRQKYSFPLKQPLSARSLTKARSRLAKKRGLPGNLVKYLEDKKQRKAEMVLTDVPPGAGAFSEPVATTKRTRKPKSTD
jgi:predicted transcriptional regulator